MSEQRVYKFDWRFIGDIERGRPTLGNVCRVEMYRLFQYSLRDVLEAKLGTEQTDLLIYKAGFLAGSEFCKQYLFLSLPLDEFLKQLKDVLVEFNLGILEIEKVEVDDKSGPRLQLSMSEDLDCSGLPDIHHATCSYDEGFIAGILRTYTGSDFEVKEVACWCLGNQNCRFEASLR